MQILLGEFSLNYDLSMAGRKRVCLCMGGWARIETQSSSRHRGCVPQTPLPDGVCERLGAFAAKGLTPSLCSAYESVNHRSVLHNKGDADRSCASSL